MQVADHEQSVRYNPILRAIEHTTARDLVAETVRGVVPETTKAAPVA